MYFVEMYWELRVLEVLDLTVTLLMSFMKRYFMVCPLDSVDKANSDLSC